jgi:hypothetical protein
MGEENGALEPVARRHHLGSVIAMLPQNVIRRHFSSWLLCLLQLALAILWCFPSLAFRQSSNPAVVVAYINHLGPVWTILFGASSLVLLYGLLAERPALKWSGHLSCAMVFMLYTCSVVVGASFDTPPGPYTTALMAVVITVGHTLMAFSYGGDR